MPVPFQVNPEADVTVWKAPGGYVAALPGGEIVANCDMVGRRLLILGASADNLSVFDYDAQLFLCGTVAQLDQ